MKVKPISYSVSLIDRYPRTNTKYQLVLCISVISFLIHCLYPYLLTLVTLDNDTSIWARVFLNPPTFDLAALCWCNPFDYDDLFSNQKHLSPNGYGSAKTRMSSSLVAEDRQHWLVSAVSWIAGGSFSINILKACEEIVSYVTTFHETNAQEIMDGESEMDNQAYIASLGYEHVYGYGDNSPILGMDAPLPFGES